MIIGNTKKTNHPKRIEGFSGTFKDFAIEIGNLPPWLVYTFFDKLSLDLIRQGKGDEKKGRRKLSSKLFECARDVQNATLQFEEFCYLHEKKYGLPSELNSLQVEVIDLFSNPKDMAFQVGNMTYDNTQKCIGELSHRFNTLSQGYRSHGLSLLADKYSQTSKHLQLASDNENFSKPI